LVEVFNKYYLKYDAWYANNLNIAASERLCIKLLAPHGVILDIGVGTGFLTSGLSETLIGVDPAENPLMIASGRGVLTVNAYGEELPFRDGAFDTVLVVVTLCFADKPLDLLREAHRVCRRGGRLIACIVPRESAWGRLYTMRKMRGESVFYEYARFYSIREVEEMIYNAGFKVRRHCSTLTYSPYTPPYIEYPRLQRDEEAGFVCIEALKE